MASRTTADVTQAAGEPGPQLRPARIQPQRRHQQRLRRQLARSGLCRHAASAGPCRSSRGSRRARRWRSIRDTAPCRSPGGSSTTASLPDAIVTIRSTDGGASFSTRRSSSRTINPFDQGTTDTSFRTNAFPTMTMDGSGRAYLAWSSRGFAPQRPDPVVGRCAHRDVDVDQRHDVDDAGAGRQHRRARASDHARR